MQRIYVLSGMPGIGKSTWAKNFQKTRANIDYVSRDEVRFSLVSEDEPYFSKEKQVFKTFINLINTSIAAGHDVIVDATHLNKASRRKLLRHLKYDKEKILIYLIIFPFDINLAKKRNLLRKGTRAYVPENVLEEMANAIDSPFLDEDEEFDILWYLEKEEI